MRWRDKYNDNMSLEEAVRTSLLPAPYQCDDTLSSLQVQVERQRDLIALLFARAFEDCDEQEIALMLGGSVEAYEP